MPKKAKAEKGKKVRQEDWAEGSGRQKAAESKEGKSNAAVKEQDEKVKDDMSLSREERKKKTADTKEYEKLKADGTSKNQLRKRTWCAHRRCARARARPPSITAHTYNRPLSWDVGACHY
jgi:hypothetical protein